MAKIAIILGTTRPESYTSKAMNIVLDEFTKKDNVKVDLVEPSNLNLLFPGQNGDRCDQKKIQDIVQNSDGVLFSTPEYHGSMSAIAKLIIENLGYPSVLAGKPVVMMGVAAGSIGAIKTLEQLRLTLSHLGAIVLPEPVSVASVQKIFGKDGVCNDERIEQLLRGLADRLLEYIDD